MRKGFHKGLKLIFLLLIYDVQVDWAYGKETCSNLFFAGESPTLEGEFGHGTVLCNTAYAVMDSPVTKGPIWSAEYIVEENLEVAARTKREGYFYPDARLPAGYRGELADWKHSGWDRGHLSPSRSIVELCAGRPPLWRHSTPGRVVPLFTGPQGRTSCRSSFGLDGDRAIRCLCRGSFHNQTPAGLQQRKTSSGRKQTAGAAPAGQIRTPSGWCQPDQAA